MRGYNVMREYFDDPVATAETIDADGWLHTGDIGVLDERGNLQITDRLKDMYVVGGFNAYPAEIEQTLTGHDAVSEVAVIGVPDERMGEVGKAFVVTRPGRLARAGRADRLGARAARQLQGARATSMWSANCRATRPARSARATCAPRLRQARSAHPGPDMPSDAG